MSEKELQEARRRLLRLKQRLGADLSDLEREALRPVGGAAGGGLSDVPIHPADLGTDNFEEELALTLMENQAQNLQEIDAALERIDNGTYGVCENCHRPIAHERLVALPYTRYCLRCASQREGLDRLSA